MQKRVVLGLGLLCRLHLRKEHSSKSDLSSRESSFVGETLCGDLGRVWVWSGQGCRRGQGRGWGWGWCDGVVDSLFVSTMAFIIIILYSLFIYIYGGPYGRFWNAGPRIACMHA